MCEINGDDVNLSDRCRNVNLKFHEISIFYNAIDRSNRGQRRRESSIRSGPGERDDLNFNNKSIAWDKIVGRLEITSLLCSLPPFFSTRWMKGARARTKARARVRGLVH